MGLTENKPERPKMKMNLSIPTNMELAGMYDAATLANTQALPEFRTVLSGLRRQVAQPGVSSAQSICVRANGEIVLIQCGKRGAIKQLWAFGNLANSAR